MSMEYMVPVYGVSGSLVNAAVHAKCMSAITSFFSLSLEKGKNVYVRLPTYHILSSLCTNLSHANLWGALRFFSQSLCLKYHGEDRRMSRVAGPGRYGYGGMCTYARI